MHLSKKQKQSAAVRGLIAFLLVALTAHTIADAIAYSLIVTMLVVSAYIAGATSNG